MSGLVGVGAKTRLWRLAVALVAAAAGCGRLHGVPTTREGWLGYRAGALSIELPEDWRARGDPMHLQAEPPEGTAQLKVERLERLFGSEAECLAQAERALERGAAALKRSRRHPTRLDGLPAIVQEGDSGAWHGWAWAACDGRRQYRISFAGVSPMSPGIFEVQRGVEGSVRFDGVR